MIAVVLVLGGLCLFVALLLAFAPEGIEDDLGFHRTEKK